MRTTTLKMATIAATLVGLMSAFSPAAVAEANKGQIFGGGNNRSGIAQNHGNRTFNRGRQLQRRSFSEYRGYNNGNRRHHNRRGFGNSYGGLYIDLGGDSSCRYSYRKWQATGSRYWRARYYDCVG